MNRNVFRRIIVTVLTLFFQGLLLFVSAWTIKWPWAWILLATAVIILIVNAIVLPREVMEERGRKKKNAEKWDNILTKAGLVPWVLTYILSGLDYRFQWSPAFSTPVQAGALIFLFAGSLLFTWSMKSNTFFSTMVRLQDDRGHVTITGGPYKYIRHPGYASFIIMSLATPVALSSLHGLLMAALSAVIFVVRTCLEDKTLKARLPGYKEYVGSVKYRLIPLVW